MQIERGMKDKILRILLYIQSLGFMKALKLLWLTHISIQHAGSKDKMFRSLNRKHGIINEFIDRNLAFARYGLFKDSAISLIAPPRLQDWSKANARKILWVFWWQGENKMPDAVKACYRNLKKFSNGWNVVLLTKDNISDYIVLPNDVLKDVGKTKSFTHLSDYIRLALLSEYGGFWIDSTIYVTRPLPRPEDITPFFTIRNEVRDNKCIGQYRWFVSLLYVSPNSTWMQHICNMFQYNWTHYKYIIDYLLMDYMFDYEQDHNATFNHLIENNKFNNPDCLSIAEHFNEPFSQEKWKEWLSKTQFFKLTYKGKLIKEINNHPTFYGHILNTQ